MPESFNEPKIENPDILEIKKRLENIEESLEKKESASEKEKIVKQEIKNYIQDVQKKSSTIPQELKIKIEEIKKFEPDQQIGILISLVFEKGLSQAITMARNLADPAILDEFHDTLVDHYFEEMVQKGIIKI